MLYIATYLPRGAEMSAAARRSLPRSSYVQTTTSPSPFLPLCDPTVREEPKSLGKQKLANFEIYLFFNQKVW